MRQVPSIAHLRRRVDEERYRRKLAALAWRDMTPPPHSAFKAFGTGSVIVPPARVTRPDCIEIGDGTMIHEHSWLRVVEVIEGIRPRLVIGSGCNIGAQCHIACVGDIEIEDDVLTAARCFIGDTYHDYADPNMPVIAQPMAKPAPVKIGRGSFLGIGSVVLMGVTLGPNAYVAAGAVVTEDVAAHTLVAGNPARPRKRWDADTETWVSV
jgi:acetyltransferase-like isoleucine patch superfamily enzyme